MVDLDLGVVVLRLLRTFLRGGDRSPMVDLDLDGVVLRATAG